MNLNFQSFRTDSFKKVEYGNDTHVADCWKMEYSSEVECIGSHLISDNALKSTGGCSVLWFGLRKEFLQTRKIAMRMK